MNKYTAKIRDAKSKISTFIFDNNLKGLKEYLNDFDEDQRAEIVNNDGGDWCVLFNACRQGHVDIVKYLILDCSADVELRCSYYIRQDSSHEGATALFVAVSEQHYPVVQLLVSHAANVNAATSYGLTPLRCACYSRNVSIVKYLVQNGANVHQPNEYSRKTLLMTAVRGPVELCTFLVNNGASVNEKTIDGYTAIWDAVMLGRLDIVKFLLHAGASPFMNIPKKVHILYVAAFAGNKVIFNFIRDNTVIDLPRLIDGYELLGATAIDKDNIQEGLELWEKAMALRYNSNPEAPLVKDIPNATKKAYLFQKECATPEQIKTLVATDKDKLYMQALLTCERILGSDCKYTIYRITRRGDVYADSKQYQRALDIWKYNMRMRRQYVPASDKISVVDLRRLETFMRKMVTEFISGATSKNVRASDVVDILEMAVTQSHEFTELLKIRPLEKNTFGLYVSLLKVTTKYMKLFFLSEDRGTENERFAEHVRRAVMLDATNERDVQFLRLTLKKSRPYDDPPSIDVVRCLIKAGAGVNATDSKRYTPLHYCIRSWRVQKNPRRADQWKNLSWLLIENGAHVDARNSGNSVPLEFLIKQNLVCKLEYTTLKCMAARVIVDAGVAYRGYLPSLLETFVELH